MLLDLLQFLPAQSSGGALILAIIGTLVGGGLWLAGVKVARPLVTLLTVVLGATIGLNLPRGCGWSISGAGPAVAGAVVLGVSGYILHRMWVGIALGCVVALWASLGAWLILHDGRAWTWPAREGRSTIAYAKSVWANVPPDIAKYLPWCWIIGIVTGLAAVIIWPRPTAIAGFASTGLTLCVASLITWIAIAQKPWLSRLPVTTSRQLTALALLLLIGAVIQWRLYPVAAGAKSSPNKREID